MSAIPNSALLPSNLRPIAIFRGVEETDGDFRRRVAWEHKFEDTANQYRIVVWTMPENQEELAKENPDLTLLRHPSRHDDDATRASLARWMIGVRSGAGKARAKAAAADLSGDSQRVLPSQQKEGSWTRERQVYLEQLQIWRGPSETYATFDESLERAKQVLAQKNAGREAKDWKPLSMHADDEEEAGLALWVHNIQADNNRVKRGEKGAGKHTAAREAQLRAAGLWPNGGAAKMTFEESAAQYVRLARLLPENRAKKPGEPLALLPIDSNDPDVKRSAEWRSALLGARSKILQGQNGEGRWTPQRQVVAEALGIVGPMPRSQDAQLIESALGTNSPAPEGNIPNRHEGSFGIRTEHYRHQNRVSLKLDGEGLGLMRRHTSYIDEVSHREI